MKADAAVESLRFGQPRLRLGCEHTETAVPVAAGDTRNELESKSVMAESCMVCSPPSAPRENLQVYAKYLLNVVVQRRPLYSAVVLGLKN